jgi:hypothetical protein
MLGRTLQACQYFFWMLSKSSRIHWTAGQELSVFAGAPWMTGVERLGALCDERIASAAFDVRRDGRRRVFATV